MYRAMERVVEVLKYLFEKLGYRIRKVDSSAPMNLLSFDGNPRALRYLKKTICFLVTGKMKDGRSLLLFPLGDHSEHPFVVAVKDAISCSLSGGDGRDAIRRKLSFFYSNYQPGCATEVLGVIEGGISMLDSQPPWVVIKPWEYLTVEERKDIIIKGEKKDNSRVSNASIGIEGGCNFCGPVSDKKLEIEVERLYSIMNSIRKYGYNRHDFIDGDVRAYVLVLPSGDWRWVVKSGQHRAAVLSALDYQEIPIRIEAIVCRDEVDLWPQVLSGNYSREMALKVFDNIFLGVGVCHIEKYSACREVALK